MQPPPSTPHHFPHLAVCQQQEGPARASERFKRHQPRPGRPHTRPLWTARAAPHGALAYACASSSSSSSPSSSWWPVLAAVAPPLPLPLPLLWPVAVVALCSEDEASADALTNWPRTRGRASARRRRLSYRTCGSAGPAQATATSASRSGGGTARAPHGMRHSACPMLSCTAVNLWHMQRRKDACTTSSHPPQPLRRSPSCQSCGACASPGTWPRPPGAAPTTRARRPA